MRVPSKKIMALEFIVFLFAICLLLTGCNTMAGLGQLAQGIGKDISCAAQGAGKQIANDYGEEEEEATHRVASKPKHDLWN